MSGRRDPEHDGSKREDLKPAMNERGSGQENRDSVHNQWLEKSLIIRRGEVVIDGCEARKRGNGLF